MKTANISTLHEDLVINKIHIIRGQKVMLDKDLAELYGVETKRLKEQVKRNIERFPSHYMFELSKEETEISRSQFATLKQGENIKYLPYAFTEHGILMLSAVLKSQKAISISIQIIDVFVKLRKAILDNNEILIALSKLDRRTDNNTKNIEIVFRYLDELIDKQKTTKPRPKIGYKIPKNN
jgi:phage regulator Rha-like protein